MTLVRFNKRNRGNLASLHNEMDDLFDSFFRGLDRPFSGYKAWPAIDVAEQDELRGGQEPLFAVVAEPDAVMLPFFEFLQPIQESR